MFIKTLPNDAGWAVYVDANELELSAGRYYPYEALIGFINKRGTLRTSSPVNAPRGWSRLARYKLEDARTQLWRAGTLRNRPAEKRRAAEEKTGSFIVKLSNGRSSRFHSMNKDTEFGIGAREWAERELRRNPDVKWAEFYRDSLSIPGGGPWSKEPFASIEKNEYGHIVQGGMKKRDARRSRRASSRDRGRSSRDGARFKIGERVHKTMGVRQAGKVIARIPRSAYTDGSYREPGPRERVTYVAWDDGTRGWVHTAHLESAPSRDPHRRRRKVRALRGGRRR